MHFRIYVKFFYHHSIYRIMPALKQTVYIQLHVSPGVGHPGVFNVDKEIKCDFNADYLRVKQITHHSGELEKDLFFISSELIDNRILGIISSESTVTPDTYFPISRPIANSSVRFTIEVAPDQIGGIIQGYFVLALEFTKELVHHR